MDLEAEGDIDEKWGIRAETNNYSIFSVSIEHVLRIGHRRGDDECKGVPAQHPDPGGPTQAYQGTCVG